MILHTVAVLVVGLTCGPTGYAWQSGSGRTEIQDDLERMLEDFDATDPRPGSEQLARYLQDLAANPVNINLAGIDELLRVPGTGVGTARAILAYREQVGPFETVEELAGVEGIGPVTVARMRSYVTVGSGSDLRRAWYSNYRYWTAEGAFEAVSRLRRTLQPRAGYRREEGSGYLGSPVGYYHRYRYKSRHLSANLTQEKDPGEPLHKPLSFDYTSWHLAVENAGRLRQLVVGDYSLSFGQGMVLWSGGAFGKGREVIGSVAKNGRGVRPYTSARETNRFRGVAATYGDRFRITGFYSDRKRGAAVIGDDTTHFPSDNGLHRTAGEIARKHTLGETTVGGRLRAGLPFGHIGVTGYRTAFDSYLVPGTAVSDRYDFRGRTGSALGVDFRALAGSTLLFGEAGRSRNGGVGWIAGLESSPDTRTELVLAYRDYAPQFQSFYGNGFAEQSGAPKNESGLYLGLRHELTSRITVSAYMDQYRFPAPAYGTTRPGRGYEWLALLEVAMNRDLRWYLQARSELEDDAFEVTDAYGRTVNRVGRAARTALRAHLEYRPNRSVRLRTRGEVVRSRRAGMPEEYGYLAYQDLRVQPLAGWTFDARMTVFDTGSYFSRVYQYENDLLYTFSNAVLFHRGQRLYVLVNCELSGSVELWAKFGVTVYEDLPYISSGLNRIEGNRKSDIGIQVRVTI